MPDIVIDEFVVFSDHHAHPFPYGSHEVEHNGVFVNDRLLASKLVIDEITAYCRTNKIKHTVFCGDMFHTRSSVPTLATNLMYDAIESLSYYSKVYMMPGNHDYADRAGKVHSLHTFKSLPNVVIFDRTEAGKENSTLTPMSKMGEQLRFSFVPYTDDRALATKEIQELSNLTQPLIPHMLFSHLGIQGAKVGSDYVLVSDSDVTTTDLPVDKFSLCLFGHYHEHQQLFKNGWYVGATHQHNWGDANTKRGFLHVRVYRDYVDFTHIESTAAPRFIVTQSEDTEVRAIDFVRYMAPKNLSLDEVTKLRSKAKSSTYEVIAAPEEAPDVMVLDADLSLAKMVSSWVDSRNLYTAVSPAKEALITTGNALLADASED